MKIVVTGSCGFLGSRIVASLRERGDEVIGIHARASCESRETTSCLDIHYGSPVEVEPALKNTDILIHLAGTSTPFESMQNPKVAIMQDLIPSLALFESAVETKVRKILFASTGGAMYGNLVSGYKAKESDLAIPSSPYGNIKLLLEKYLDEITRDSETSHISLRLSNAYGPGQLARPNFGVIPNFISQIEAGEPLSVRAKESTRDYIFVDDVISAFKSALEYEGNYKVFNIGTGLPTSLEALIRILEKYLTKKAIMEDVEQAQFPVTHSCLSVELAKSEMGWKPEITLDSGLRKTLARIS